MFIVNTGKCDLSNKSYVSVINPQNQKHMCQLKKNTRGTLFHKEKKN